ncbi:hypothetical protein [Kitasatospora sp. NPDC101183]|uniref:hypothetical protein n=1 Tax=Kitasatospora sp. NPDC101183 TaxID=3364100 RepID=UPI0037F655A0
MTRSTDVEELRSLVAHLIGAVVERTGVPLDGEGRFGLRLRTTESRPRWLMVHAAAWRLASPDAVVAASGDRTDRLAEDLSTLTGREVTALDVRLPGWETVVHFGELELRIFPLYHRTSSAVPDWILRSPSGRHLAVGPGPRWAATA